MRYIPGLISQTRNAIIYETVNTISFHIPLYYTEFDSVPIIPKITIENNTFIVTVLKNDKISPIHDAIVTKNDELK